MSNFDGKIILIVGGTGYVGQCLVEVLLKHFSPKIIRILSRDETKQLYLAKKLKKYDEKLRFFIGDIRDKERLERAMVKVDIVFHLAAMKHVVACEYNPFEAIKTNVIGLQNLIEVSINNNVDKFVFASTDKAATPCNTMGVTKLLGEKLVTSANYYKGNAKTIFYSVRFGNILGSSGSLIPLIADQVKNYLPITLTHREMSRYIMDSNNAIDLVLKTLDLARGGEIFVLKMNSVKIIDLIEVLIEYYAEKHDKMVEKIKVEVIGMFAGEKLYEELFSIEEAERTYEMDDMYLIIPQLTEVSNKLDLKNYPNIKRFNKSEPYNSNESKHLSKEEIKNYLVKNKII